MTKLKILLATAFKSCDNCRSQEGRHYCRLWGLTMKNMDTKHCNEWQTKERAKQR